MNIIYISNSIIPSQAANSVHVMKMCSALSKYAKVQLLAMKSNEKNNNDIFVKYNVGKSFEVLLFDRNSKRFGAIEYIYKTLFFSIKASGEKVFYGRYIYTLALLSLIYKNVSYEAHTLPRGVKYFFEKFMFRRKGFNKLVVISDVLKQDYLKIFPELNHKIIVAHDGADLPSSFTNKTIDCSSINVGYIGSLYKGRGIDIIVLLARKFQTINFYIYGGTKEEVSQWLKETNDVKNIFFKGFISQNSLKNEYENIDIMLAPYQKGPNLIDGKTDTTRWMSPMKIFEYMSYKKAIIVSDFPVLREVLSEDNSILVSPDEFDAWQLALKKLLDNQSLREQLSQRAFDDFKAKYQWSERAEKIFLNISNKDVV